MSMVSKNHKTERKLCSSNWVPGVGFRQSGENSPQACPVIRQILQVSGGSFSWWPIVPHAQLRLRGFIQRITEEKPRYTKTMLAPLRDLSLLCTLAFSAMLSAACPFHDHSSRQLWEEVEDPASSSSFHNHHEEHNHRLVADSHSTEDALMSDADHRKLYPGPYLHERLPKNFKLCGSKEPSRKDLNKLGLTFAKFDRRHGFEGNTNQQFVATATQALLAANVTKIPVYFHNFLQNATYGKLTKQQIKQGLMTTLNKGFKGSGFQFVFKSVSYHVNPTWFACDDATNMHRQTYTGNGSTLNVWICNLAAKGLGGTAYLPPILDSLPYLDGVNLMNPVLGQSEFAHQAFVHETGRRRSRARAIPCKSLLGHLLLCPTLVFQVTGWVLSTHLS